MESHNEKGTTLFYTDEENEVQKVTWPSSHSKKADQGRTLTSQSNILISRSNGLTSELTVLNKFLFPNKLAKIASDNMLGFINMHKWNKRLLAYTTWHICNTIYRALLSLTFQACKISWSDITKVSALQKQRWNAFWEPIHLIPLEVGQLVRY